VEIKKTMEEFNVIQKIKDEQINGK